MTTTERVNDLVKQLNTIAKRNHDAFQYSVELSGFPVRFRFVAIEKADGHEFVDGSGTTLDDAVISAEASIKDACEQWGYEQ